MSRHNRERRRLRREEKAARGPALPAPKPEHPPARYDQRVSVAGNPASRGTPQPVFILPRFRSGILLFTPPVA
jgi:hypothetical protein